MRSTNYLLFWMVCIVLTIVGCINHYNDTTNDAKGRCRVTTKFKQTMRMDIK
jgi:hypothetical protein